MWKKIHEPGATDVEFRATLEPTAGGIGSGKVSETSDDLIHRTFETNFFAPVALTRMGTNAAPMEISEGGKTGWHWRYSARTGQPAFIHLGKPLPR